MSIRLSPKHGVNPSLSQCFYCGGDKNEIMLPGLMRGDVEAPRKAVWNMEPCEECKGHMAAGIILISVDESKSKSDLTNPYRSGGWIVVKEELIKQIIATPDFLADILKKRVAFLPDEVWDKLELPRAKNLL